MSVDEWLEQLYAWEGSDDALADEIYDHLTVSAVEPGGMNGWIMHKDANEILTKIDVTRLDSTALVGFLSVTYAALWIGSGKVGNVRHELTARPAFYDRVAEELRKRDEDRVEDILRGLK